MKILEKEGKEARFGQIEWNNTFVLSPMIDSSYQTLKRDYKINLSPSIYQKKIGFIGVTRGWKFEVFIGGAGEEDGVTSAGFVSTVSRRQITESGGRDAVEFAAFAGGTQASGNRRGRTG